MQGEDLGHGVHVGLDGTTAEIVGVDAAHGQVGIGGRGFCAADAVGHRAGHGAGTLGADMEPLEEMIIRLSQLLIDFPEIAELDMNPVLIKDGKPVAVDARILVSPLAVPSSLHLVIGPYPQEDESHMISVDGRRIFVRPVKPEDAPLFTTLFETLSPTTIYYRFFGTLKELNSEMLARFTQIDYDREIALVAIGEDSETENMLGVARIIGDPDGQTGEFAVLVGDAWQGKGIGSNLLEKCLSIAEKQGIEDDLHRHIKSCIRPFHCG